MEIPAASKVSAMACWMPQSRLRAAHGSSPKSALMPARPERKSPIASKRRILEAPRLGYWTVYFEELGVAHVLRALDLLGGGKHAAHLQR